MKGYIESFDYHPAFDVFFFAFDVFTCIFYVFVFVYVFDVFAFDVFDVFVEQQQGEGNRYIGGL